MSAGARIGVANLPLLCCVASAFRQLGCWAYTVHTKRFRTIR
ncbi:MAG: hypothetical protein WBW48_12975 [Anaerolineae bacterium]